ncbi:MAG TPA: hypothetical protein PKE47_06250 [Verrucomicrobiota bacterium]|nr:hypothetical protein [Verrucomicrobiota bacterium]
MTFHRGPADAEGGCRARHFQLAAALAQHAFKERVEPVHVAKPKQALDVTGEKRIHPLAIKRGLLGLGQERGGESAVQQPARQRNVPEGGQLAPEHRQEMHQAFAARQRDAKLPARGERRAAGRQDPQFREQVRAHLEQPAGVAELVNLIEDHHRLGQPR